MRDHKSLMAWQQAHTVVIGVYRLSDKHWRPSSGAVFRQLQRSALSVQLNIAEGHAQRTDRLFRRHLTIAYGSMVETIDLLELLIEIHAAPQVLVAEVLGAARRTRSLLLGLLHRYDSPSVGKEFPATTKHVQS